MSLKLRHIQPPSAALSAMRFIFGLIFFAHGAQKVMGWFGGYGLSATAVHMGHALHIPGALMYLAAFVEFFGGIALMLGVLSRVFALAIFIELIVATLKVHLPVGFFLNWGSVAGHGEGIEFNLALPAMASVIVLAGPGVLAIADWEPALLHKRMPRAEAFLKPRFQA